MPRTTSKEVGRVYVTRTELTFGDKLKNAAQNIIGFLAILMFIGLIFGG